MRGFILGVIFTIVVGLGCVYLFLYMGKLPMGADNPPGNIEKSMANMAVDSHVEHNADKQENPTQINSANLIEGAHEYEDHCAFCHGGAQALVSPMSSKFNPPVPQIINRPPHDPDANLFWITKHGIRLTGMPSWSGILTDDEIWKIVAFVKRSKSLPPDVDAAWHKAAAESHQPGENEQGEHERHMHPPR